MGEETGLVSAPHPPDNGEQHPQLSVPQSPGLPVRVRNTSEALLLSDLRAALPGLRAF